MEWWLILVVFFVSLIGLMLIGLPVALSFILVSLGGSYWLWGGLSGFEQIITSLFSGLAHFSLVTVVLFILMGETTFRSGISHNVLDAVDQWVGRLPGRLGLVAVGAGSLFACMSGSSMSSIAVFGKLLVPEMERRGYKKPMSLGPILGSGGLSIMIPPTALGIILAVLTKVSVAELLIAIIIPGLIMALCYILYIVLRCYVQPHIAPNYEKKVMPLRRKLMFTLIYIVPIGGIIFLVLGLIFLGVATPSEAAATGAAGVFLLAACYKKLTWTVLIDSLTRTAKTSIMVLFILAGAMVFSQILAISGATQGFVEFVTGLSLPPILLLILLQIVLIILGCFMENMSIMMITMPIFMPIAESAGFNPIWFSVIVLLNMEMAATSPPFGLSLFVMKAVSPPDTTMWDLYKAATPFLICDAIALAIIIAFPGTALYLVNLMH